MRLNTWITECAYIKALLSESGDGKEVPDRLIVVAGRLAKGNAGMEDSFKHYDYLSHRDWSTKDLQPQLSFAQWMQSEVSLAEQEA